MRVSSSVVLNLNRVINYRFCTLYVPDPVVIAGVDGKQSLLNLRI